MPRGTTEDFNTVSIRQPEKDLGSMLVGFECQFDTTWDYLGRES